MQSHLFKVRHSSKGKSTLLSMKKLAGPFAGRPGDRPPAPSPIARPYHRGLAPEHMPARLAFPVY